MKVRMTTGMVGPEMRHVGQVIEVPAEEAARLIEKGFAAPAPKHAARATARRSAVRTATAPPVETPEG